eukprot:gnl/Dysnectes_brevis/3076_a3822_767.p1 GENE.gnl/Dysnectes_brevis/3076_a3822_767~~gnl/Dysnectes_brevis/3076_a3822_767.p1  ORF type:complete len:160 (+),score=57.01 gnl/Dysnectes_brevis/3076_a3822_767:738-1217(+)
MPVPFAFCLADRLLGAVCKVHEEGWTHLDIKPENVLSQAFEVRLCDWGTVGRNNGRPQYLSSWSEGYAMDLKRCSVWHDVYSLGCMLERDIGLEPIRGLGVRMKAAAEGASDEGCGKGRCSHLDQFLCDLRHMWFEKTHDKGGGLCDELSEVYYSEGRR